MTDASPQTVAPSSQEVAGQQQQIQVDSATDHVPAYSYQSKYVQQETASANLLYTSQSLYDSIYSENIYALTSHFIRYT